MSFDGLKVVQKDWFFAMRKNSYDQDDWHYALFFFVLLFIAEIIPNLMFIFNLNEVLGNKVLLRPKLSVEYQTKV